MDDTFTITCYGQTKTYKESERRKMIDEYTLATYCCEGSEGERYALILCDLEVGMKECKDEWD